MTNYADWVPQEVIDFLEGLPDSDGFGTARNYVSASGVDSLKRAIESPNMAPAWKTIARRRKDCDPSEFAQAILTVTSLSERMSRYASSEHIEDMYAIAKKTQELAEEVARKARKESAEDWYGELGYPLRKWFKSPPYQTLCDLAEYFDCVASDLEERRTELTAYVGQPGAEDAKRIFAIRLMSEEMNRLYGQPLHEVVALTCEQIFEQIIHTDNVKKLVKLSDNLPPPYWAG